MVIFPAESGLPSFWGTTTMVGAVGVVGREKLGLQADSAVSYLLMAKSLLYC